jgi:hypothetical protein
VFQIAFSNIGPFASCQVSLRLKLPGGIEKTYSANVDAGDLHCATWVQEVSASVAPSSGAGVHARINKRFQENRITVSLFHPADGENGMEVSLTLHTAAKGYAVE